MIFFVLSRSRWRSLRSLWLAVLSAVIVWLPSASHALTVEEVPNPRQLYGSWVSDMATILSRETENQLNQLISDLEAAKGAEVAIVTVPTTLPSPSPKAFTTDLFKLWRIGKVDQNNGVLFLVSVGDRRVEIETGSGLTRQLPNDAVNTIIQQQVIPRFKENDFEGGVLMGTQAVVERLMGNPGNLPIPASTAGLLGLVLTGGVLLLVRLARSHGHASNRGFSSSGSGGRNFSSGRTGGRDFSGSDFGGGDFGGGDSGGGDSGSGDSGGGGFGGGDSDGGGAGGGW